MGVFTQYLQSSMTYTQNIHINAYNHICIHGRRENSRGPGKIFSGAYDIIIFKLDPSQSPMKKSHRH
jgi:hypothetical protein